MRGKWRHVLAFLLTLVLINAVNIIVNGYDSANNLANSVNVSAVTLESVDLIHGSARGYYLKVGVILNNTAHTQLTLDNVKCEVYVNGTRLGSAGLNDIVVPAESIAKENVQFNVTGGDAVRKVTQAILRGKMPLEVHINGYVPVSLFGIRLSSVHVSKSTSSVADVEPYLGEYLKSQIKVYMLNPNTSSSSGLMQATRNGSTLLGSSSDELVRVVSVKWYSNGHEVTKVGKHQSVEVRITFEKLKNSKVDLEIEVRRDIKWLPDSDLIDNYYSYDLSKTSKYFTVTLPFTTEDKHLLRGYFVRVKIHGYCEVANGAIADCWIDLFEQPSHYPPRLKVG